jgi:tripartite-type tricarboxylate transporter receptor subunit TctC
MKSQKCLSWLSLSFALALAFVTLTSCSPSPPPPKAPAADAPKASSAAAAGSVADFYKGKALTIGVTAGTGGVTDVYARLMAKYLPDLIGVKVGVVNNDAAGGMAYFNELYNTTKPDGLTVLLIAPGTVWRPWLVDDPAVKYDPMKYEYLAGQKNGQYILTVGTKTPYKTADDLKKAKGLKFAASAPTSGLTLTNCLAIEVLGLDAKVIAGYSGSDGRLMAIAQGEVDGYVGSSDYSAKNEKDGLVRAILQIGLKRMAPWPNLPCLAELADQTESNKSLLKALDAYSDSKMIIAPPGTPKDRVKFLSDAFGAIYANPEFVSTVEQLTGEKWLGSLTMQECIDAAKNVPSYKPMMQPYNDLAKKYIKK